jgi:hypothetical protein
MKRGSNGGIRRDFSWRRKKVTWPWLVGPTHQRGKEETGYRFGFLRWAADLFRYWAENRPRGPFSFSFLFFFSFSVFLISLITFANLVQIASNQLCKVSKIQNNIPEQ